MTLRGVSAFPGAAVLRHQRVLIQSVTASAGQNPGPPRAAAAVGADVSTPPQSPKMGKMVSVSPGCSTSRKLAPRIRPHVPAVQQRRIPEPEVQTVKGFARAAVMGPPGPRTMRTMKSGALGARWNDAHDAASTVWRAQHDDETAGAGRADRFLTSISPSA